MKMYYDYVVKSNFEWEYNLEEVVKETYLGVGNVIFYDDIERYAELTVANNTKETITYESFNLLKREIIDTLCTRLQCDGYELV